MALTQVSDAGLVTPASDLQDNEKIVLGTGNDLEVFHSGTYSYIKNSHANGLWIASDLISLTNAAVTENLAKFTANGSVELCYDGTKKLETTSAGVTFTGDTILNGSGDTAMRWALSGTNKWSIYHNTSGSSNHLEIFDNNGSGAAAKFKTNGAAELYYDNTKKIETTSAGVTITGDLTVTGSSPGGAITSDGDDNTVGGTNAGNAGTWSGATDNTCFGKDAGTDLTSGDNNTFFGSRAGESIQGGHRNIGIGGQAVRYGTGCSNNVGIGYNVFENTTGSNNIGIGGEDCATQITSGNSNIALGQQAMNHLKEGHYNIAIGYYAAQGAYNATTSGQQYNISLGAEAGKGLTTGNNNYSIGKEAGKSISTGYHNVAIGLKAGDGITTGIDNIVVGQEAGDGITTGGYNICLGKNSMGVGTTTASHNIAIGTNALEDSTSGTENIALGLNAAKSLTTGHNNIAIGYQALATQIDGAYTVAIGPYALEDAENNANGSKNTAVGYGAAKNLTTGEHITAIGYLAGGTGVITGDYNTLIGRQAGELITSGADNTAIGSSALTLQTTSSQNTALGAAAGNQVTTGSYNVLIGYRAGSYSNGITTGNKNIVIGTDAHTSAVDAEYQIVIGTHQDIGKGNNTGYIQPASGGVYQGNNSSSWSTTSDRRIKKNIVDNNTGLDAINQITVRNFEYRSKDEIIEDYPELTDVVESAVVDKSGTQLGCIAQEIESILPDIVKTESTGVKSVNPDNLTWYLVNAVKELSAKVTALENA